MSAIIVETSGELRGPPEVVWELLTDWERQSDWMLESSDIVVTSDRREGVGVEAEATVGIGGIRTRDRIRVDGWDPPRHLGIVHLGWVGGRGDIRLTSSGEERTHMHWREELHPPWGFVGVAGLRLFRPLMARIFRRDLGELRKLVQARVTRRYPGETE